MMDENDEELRELLPGLDDLPILSVGQEERALLDHADELTQEERTAAGIIRLSFATGDITDDPNEDGVWAMRVPTNVLRTRCLTLS